MKYKVYFNTNEYIGQNVIELELSTLDKSIVKSAVQAQLDNNEWTATTPRPTVREIYSIISVENNLPS